MAHSVTPPVAERRDHVRSFHGDVVHDPYEWLRDKHSPDTIAYLEAENSYTAAMTADLEPLTTTLLEARKARTQQTDQSVPEYATSSDGSAWWYYRRTVTGQDYAIHCRMPADGRDSLPDLDGERPGEQILVDGNVEASGHEFFALGGLEVSPAGNRVAFLADYAGDERFVLVVRDLASGQNLPDRLEDLGYGVCWAGDDQLIYARVDDAWRQHEIWRHRLGTDPATDELLFHEADERFSCSAFESRRRDLVLIASQSKLTSEWHLLPTDDPEARPQVIQPRVDGLDYEVEPAADRLFIVHNASCPDMELAWAPLHSPGREHWTTLIPGTPGVRIQAADAYRDALVVTLRRDGLTRLHLVPRAADGSCGSGQELVFDEPIYTVGALGDADYDTDRVRIAFTSLVTPPTVFDCAVETGALTLRKREPVLDDPARGPYRSEDYVQTRTWATAADGARVPISLVHRKDMTLDGSNPCLLYGYGSYEFSVDPTFSIARIPLLERGFVFAIAHVRGGGELGRRWYDQGKTLQKKNTFSDFVACAHHLIEAGYTNPDRLAAQGRSAGGLLMGAITNLAPTTFRAVHAGVPFVDALTSILMPELPLTVTEWDEWGDPFHDPEVYAYMRSYTPYENIQPGRYPAILATTSLNDTRVLYVEPAKWVAALRHTVAADDARPILLHTQMVAGHGGVSGRYGAWEQTAFEHAWICTQLAATDSVLPDGAQPAPGPGPAEVRPRS